MNPGDKQTMHQDLAHINPELDRRVQSIVNADDDYCLWRTLYARRFIVQANLDEAGAIHLAHRIASMGCGHGTSVQESLKEQLRRLRNNPTPRITPSNRPEA